MVRSRPRAKKGKEAKALMFRPAAAKARPKAAGRGAPVAAKAKAKGKARAKAKGKAAAAPRLRAPRHRPAANIPPGRAGGSAEEKYKRGEEIEAHEVSPFFVSRGDWWESKKSSYQGAACEWAGKVVRCVIEGGEAEAEVHLSGTQTEALLRFGSGKNPAEVRVHLCGQSCDGSRTNPNLLHCRALRKISEESEKTWQLNLTPGDDLAALREAHDAWKEHQQPPGREAEKVESSESSGTKKKKKKKKKKKDKEKAKKKYGGRTRARKKAGDLYQGTGLDPDPKIRRKVMKMVKKRLKKDKSESSGSGGSSTTSSEVEIGEDILDDRSKVHRISVLGPGCLAASAIEQMKLHLLQANGATWGLDEEVLPPVMTQYVRTHLSHRATGGLLREALNLAYIGDLLLQNRPAEALDTLAQRLKSVEMVAHGQPWALAQKVELPPSGEAQIMSRAEAQVALKEAKADQVARPAKPPWEPSKGKGKNKTQDKGKQGDKGGKGKKKDEQGKNS